MSDLITFELRTGPEELATSNQRQIFEKEVLPAYLAEQRWFPLKDQSLKSVRIVMTMRIGKRREMILTEIEVVTEGGSVGRYILPLAISWDSEAASQTLPKQFTMARVRRGHRAGYLTDAFAIPEFARSLSALFTSGA
jgi:maltose alpha-D-glucosyltransferase/alpha-amylase